MDTVFIVMKKSWRQLSFLHVYHHCTIFLVRRTPVITDVAVFCVFHARWDRGLAVFGHTIQLIGAPINNELINPCRIAYTFFGGGEVLENSVE